MCDLGWMWVIRVYLNGECVVVVVVVVVLFIEVGIRVRDTWLCAFRRIPLEHYPSAPIKSSVFGYICVCVCV